MVKECSRPQRGGGANSRMDCMTAVSSTSIRRFVERSSWMSKLLSERHPSLYLYAFQRSSSFGGPWAIVAPTKYAQRHAFAPALASSLVREAKWLEEAYLSRPPMGGQCTEQSACS